MPHSIEHEDTVKLWIGTEDDPADRVTVVITKEDYALLPVKNGRDWDRAVEVQDQVTRRVVKIRRAACGLPGCNCALEFADAVSAAAMWEYFAHDVCPGCGRASLPLEGVPDQSGRGCGQCGREWVEDLDRPARTAASE